MKTSIKPLRQLAELHDIQTSYLSMDKTRRAASADVLIAVLAVLGVRVGAAAEVREALHEARERRWRECVPPVIVAWNGQPTKLRLRLPIELARRNLACRLELEGGGVKTLAGRPERWPTVETGEFDSREYLAKELTLPALPPGYHRFVFESAAAVSNSLVIAAPARCYSVPGRRDWGVFLPLYALHSEAGWGAGHFGEWRQLGDWIASLGGGVAGTLPLLAAYLDEPAADPSPYAPASRLFWNEFYIDIERVPEFAQCPAARRLARSSAFQRKLEGFRRRSLIDYRAEMDARRRVLEQLAEWFYARKDSARWRAFRQFTSERPEVEDYARFRAAREQTGQNWNVWPQSMRDGKLVSGDYSEAAMRYHLYVQWQAHEQMRALVEHCRRQGVEFYLDLPLGVHAGGYDAWRERQAFASEANAGAPPDPVFTQGQDWGFAPLHPRRIRQQGYRYVLEYLRFQMRHTGLLRIDHVMSLYRLYWIPHGNPASEGAYVKYPSEELHALLCLESNRNKTVVVGENLGTVPPEVNAGMKRHHLRQMYVVQYEVKPDPRRGLRPPPAPCVASFNTHDMPPFQAFWLGEDIKDRFDLGLIPKEKLSDERQTRRKMNQTLIQFLRRQSCLKANKPGIKEVYEACLDWLGASPAEIVLINLEDLWRESQSQNVPGSSLERPNWRRKTRYTIEQIRQLPPVQDLLVRLNEIRKKTGVRRPAKQI